MTVVYETIRDASSCEIWLLSQPKIALATKQGNSCIRGYRL